LPDLGLIVGELNILIGGPPCVCGGAGEGDADGVVVGQRFESFFDRAWRSEESRVTKLVIIGQDLDEVAIRAKLEVKI
jgi:Cobalamin synthesis protein cobW C-terminal domain